MNRSSERLVQFRPRKEWRRIGEEEWALVEEELRLGRLEGGTRNNYETGVQAWFQYCRTYQTDSTLPTINNIKQFMMQLGLSGYGYGPIRNYIGGVRH